MQDLKPFLFLFASLGVINGLLIGLYLLWKKEGGAAGTWFGALLLTLSIRIGKSIYFYFTDEVNLTILQIGLSSCLFIGPFFYLYLKSKIKEKEEYVRQDILLVTSLLLLCLSVGFIYPYSRFPEYWTLVFVKVIYGVWAIFLFLGIYESRFLLRRFFTKRKVLEYQEKRMAMIVFGMLFITCTYQFAYYVDGFTYLWGALIFTAAFYFLLAEELRSWRKKSETKSKKRTDTTQLENGTGLLDALDQLMVEKKLFKNPKLRLDDLALESGQSKHDLSRLLNEAYPHGFAHYINEKRVSEAKRLIRTDSMLSLEGIGYEAGFNSKSSFYSVFKKHLQLTPAQYRKKIGTVD